MGCVCLLDALITTFISTPSGVSGEHYDKLKQQQRRTMTCLYIRRSYYPIYKRGSSSAIYS
jgi:hypothetical protein